MIWLVLLVGAVCLTVGVYLGAAGMAILVAEKMERYDMMRGVVVRQAGELLDVRKDASRWQRAALIAEAELTPEQEARVLSRELVS
jgi:hypothetical protein